MAEVKKKRWVTLLNVAQCRVKVGSFFAAKIRSFLMVTTLIRWHSALSLISKTTKKVGKVRLGMNGLYCPFSTTLPPPNSPRTSKVCLKLQSRLWVNLKKKNSGTIFMIKINQIEFKQIAFSSCT